MFDTAQHDLRSNEAGKPADYSNTKTQGCIGGKLRYTLRDQLFSVLDMKRTEKWSQVQSVDRAQELMRDSNVQEFLRILEGLNVQL